MTLQMPKFENRPSGGSSPFYKHPCLLHILNLRELTASINKIRKNGWYSSEICTSCIVYI